MKLALALLFAGGLAPPGLRAQTLAASAVDAGGGTASVGGGAAVVSAGQGAAGAFQSWGDVPLERSGTGFAYSGLLEDPSSDGSRVRLKERPLRFERKAPDAGAPEVAGRTAFEVGKVRFNGGPGRAIAFGLPKAELQAGLRLAGADAAVAAPLPAPERIRDEEGEAVLYREVEEGVDIRYAQRGNRLEEDIILKRPPRKASWRFDLDLEGLTPEVWPDGTVRFRDVASGQITAYFDKPFMVDAAGARSEAVRLTLGGNSIDVEADAIWLAQTARAYPVVVDPTLVFVSTIGGLSGGWPNHLRIHKDGSGRLHVIARSPAGLGYSLSLDNGGTFSPVVLTTSSTLGCPGCAVTTDFSGNVHVVWRFNSIPFTDAVLVGYQNNIAGAWSSPQLVASNTAFFRAPAFGYPSVELAADQGGALHLIWNSDASGGTIFYSKKPQGGVWTAPVAIHDPLTRPLHQAALAMDSNGKLHVAACFNHSTASLGYAVYLNNAAGAWSTSETVYGQSCEFPAIALDGSNLPRIAVGKTGPDAKLIYLEKAGETWAAVYSLRCRGSPVPLIGLDSSDKVHLLCGIVGLLGELLPRQLFQASNAGGFWGPATANPFDRVIGSISGQFDRVGRKWNLAMYHGQEGGGFTGPGPGSFVSINDLQPPSLITDLRALPGPSSGTIALSWTAPGDDGRAGKAARYDVKAATSPIPDQATYDALPLYASWTPAPTGASESRVLTGLLGGTTYYVALLAFDDENLASFILDAASVGPGTVTPLSILRWGVPAVAAASDTDIRPPAELRGEVLADLRARLDWQASPSSATVSAYRVYWDSGTGSVDYTAPLASVAAPATTYTTGVLSPRTYRFGLRAVAANGIEDGNVSAAAVVVVSSAAAAGTARAEIKVPQGGRKVSGDRVTVMAQAVLGRARQVELQVRRQGLEGAWTRISPAAAGHANPDPEPPYFVHWDVSGLEPGNYELRAVAEDFLGRPDAAAPAVTVAVDPADPDREERVVGGVLQLREKAHNAVGTVARAGEGGSGALTTVSLPAGALSQATATLKLVLEPPGAPPPPRSLSRAFVREITLESGQTALNAPATISLEYADADGDGIVDGTTARADRLKVYVYDVPSGLWRQESPTAVDTLARRVSAQTAHFSLFGLFSPAAADLSDVLVYPVPWVPGDGDADNGKPFVGADPQSGIVFDNLTQGVRIQVFTVTGELVWERDTDASSGKVQWDGKNLGGREVASGGYFAVIKDKGSGGSVVRKLAIVR